MIHFFSKWLTRWRQAAAPPKMPPASQQPALPSLSSNFDDPFPAPVELEITDVFDLHSIPPKQIKAVVTEYLQLARLHGFAVVRLIHGKGIGVQREQVRAILNRTPFVIEFHDAPDASSWGATIAYLQVEPFISEGVSDSQNAPLE